MYLTYLFEPLPGLEDRAPWALGSSGLLSVPRLQSETHYTSYKDSPTGMKMLKPTTNRKKQPFISAWP